MARLTRSWDPWDVEHSETLARIEVKQSSHLQAWSRDPQKKQPKFNIPPKASYWWACPKGEFHWLPLNKQRQADVYVFAWHGEADPVVADHRNVAQWRFFVVPEQKLPNEQQSISLNPLRDLADPEVEYTDLAAKVEGALPDTLKTVELPETCRYCPT